ncbi:MAG: phosphate regulon transcriptional regulator PhoB [Pseudomonadota bacterium]
MGVNVLVVEDEPAIREMLSYTLEEQGYKVTQASTTEKAMSLLQEGENIDIIILDWMLPGAPGIDFAQRLKRKEAYAQIPVIMLTARGEEDDRVKGLDSGVDDYVVKPFSPKELLARIRALLRRINKEDVNKERIELGGIKLDDISHRVTVKGGTIHLGPTEYKLLHFFMENPDRVFSREQLLNGVWGNQVFVEERTVDVHIRRLRKALADYDVAHYVQTVRGTGYRFSHKV